MGEPELLQLSRTSGISPRRLTLARWVESRPVQVFIIAVILLNAAVMGMETSATAMAKWGSALILIDKLCLADSLGKNGSPR